MRKKYIKFSDERNRKYSIKTIIWDDNGKSRVTKEAIFFEGKEHIKKIHYNKELLQKYYDVDICDSWIQNEIIEFEFISGKSLESKYTNCWKRNDIDAFKELLISHKAYILGKTDNLTTFEDSEDFDKLFGKEELFTGVQALQCSNFDAIASNIIYRNNRPVFIDYEWVYEFPIPVDLLIYHCLFDLYSHNEELENFFPLRSALEVLEVKLDLEILEKAYETFHRHIITDDDNSYALVKAICLKSHKTLEEFDHEHLILQCEIDRLQGVIQSINENLIKKETELLILNNEFNDIKSQNEMMASQLKEICESKTWRIFEMLHKLGKVRE
ncbi:MAG: hypothetical protein HFJ06_04415 [Lachnospiraceae bacterium]|nr:hypothetical protein [Lachnospiraceae bacterium]